MVKVVSPDEMHSVMVVLVVTIMSNVRVVRVVVVVRMERVKFLYQKCFDGHSFVTNSIQEGT